MANEFLEMKKLVIQELMAQLDETDVKEISKEFGMSEEKLDLLVKKVADKWLSNPDHIIMIATLLGISMPRSGKERDAEYIG